MVPAFGLGILGLALTAVGDFMDPRGHRLQLPDRLHLLGGHHRGRPHHGGHLPHGQGQVDDRCCAGPWRPWPCAVPIFAVLFLGLIPAPQAPVPLGARLARWPRTCMSIERWAPGPQAARLPRTCTFFFVRQVIYFGVWIFVSQRLHGWSTQQDETGELDVHREAALPVPGRPALPCAHHYFCCVRLADEPHAALAVHHLRRLLLRRQLPGGLLRADARDGQRPGQGPATAAW